MMHTLRKAHVAAGILGLIVFVLQGQYMDHAHDHLIGMQDAPRMLYRSAHIYFLLATLLNVLLGVYITDARTIVSKPLQSLVSAIVLIAPAVLLAGFFLEPEMNELARPYSRLALYALFVMGVVLSMLGLASLTKKSKP